MSTKKSHILHDRFDPELLSSVSRAELEAFFEAISSIPDRDRSVVARNQARFMAELEGVALPKTSPSTQSRLINWLRSLSFGKLKEGNRMKHPTKRFAFSGLAIAAMGAIFLFGGTGTTAYAYQNSLPGDTLYPVKTSFEQTQVLLSGDAANRSALHLQFADRRMSEIALLAQSGRFSAVSVTAHHYALSMASAASEAHLLAKSNPAQSAVLTQKIASELARNSRMLSDVKNGVPDAVKVEIEDAVHAADQGVKSAGDDAGEMENTPIPTMKSTIGVTMTPGVEDNNEKEKEKEKEDEKEGNHGKKTATPAPTMTATQMENTATMMPTETPTQMENTATMMPTETPTQMENTATMMPTETPTQMENTATMMPTETPIPTVGVSSNQGNGGSAHDKGGNGNDKGGGHH